MANNFADSDSWAVVSRGQRKATSGT
ncbi:hypothetical protein E3A20_22960, partial [Planctomyces bekefii]